MLSKLHIQNNDFNYHVAQHSTYGGSVQWPQDAADRHRTLFLVIFWAPIRSRQQ